MSNPRSPHRPLPACALTVALCLAGTMPSAQAGAAGLEVCRGLAGTYVTAVSDREGVFASRGLLTFTGDGVFLDTDSAQGGVPGVFEPFTTVQGAWQCSSAQGGRLEVVATGLNFVLPGNERPQAFGRTDYRLTLDTATGSLSGSVELRFTQDADLEGADPLGKPGPLVDTFQVEGRRLAPGLPAR